MSKDFLGFGRVAKAMDAHGLPAPETFGIAGSNRDKALQLAAGGVKLTESQRVLAGITEQDEKAAAAGSWSLF